MTIRPITPAQTYALRHAVLWLDKPLDYVKLPDDDAGQHFGALEEENLVSVISLFISPDGTARFRKFATDPAWQGRGIGSALLTHTLAAATAQGAMPGTTRWPSMSGLGCNLKATFFIKVPLLTCACGGLCFESNSCL